MNRRNFIRNTSFTGAAIGSLGMASCKNAGKKQDPKTTVEPGPGQDDFLLNEVDIETLQNKMQSGALTSQSITQMYLDRITKIDKAGPSINAIIELNPDAMSIAAKMDEERKQGKTRGLLHGIPILVKDNINTGDKMMTTAGALALSGNIVKKDAFIIQKLREAGAVLMGKTNLSEWANFRSNRSTSGWSSRGGQTLNPYVLDRGPCGSSSGSGAAVSANLCTLAIGTETDGSIIAPSSFCGIVGFKPTVGLWSRTGIIPISRTQDTAGPMTRTVKDAAILMSALAGTDPEDEYTVLSDKNRKSEYLSFLDADGLHGKKIGIEKSFLKGREGVVAIYKEAIELLKSKGASIVEIDFLAATRPGGQGESTVFQYEFKDGVNQYLARYGAPLKSLAEIIAYNKKEEKKAMPFFKQELLELSNEKGDLNSKEYKEALERSIGCRKVIEDIFRENQLDAMSGVSIGPPCCIDLVNGDYDTGFYFCPPAARSGYPHITVPMGYLHGLPLGFSFMARAYEEPKLFTLAYAYEQASKKRRLPGFASVILKGED